MTLLAGGDCRLSVSSLRWLLVEFGGGGYGGFVEEHGGAHLFVAGYLFVAVGAEAESRAGVFEGVEDVIDAVVVGLQEVVWVGFTVEGEIVGSP